MARHAERIGKMEAGNLAVILCAAFLHDIGILEAQRKHNSAAGRYQEQEGPPIARGILEKLGAKEALIDEVCDIVAHHHHPREDDTVNFKVLYDADLIVNLEEENKEKPKTNDELGDLIDRAFLTESGKAEARKAFNL